MSKRFSFFDNEEAMQEIRRHKWIESEKKGQEIGFATAAIDWINKYGDTWKKHHLSKDQN